MLQGFLLHVGHPGLPQVDRWRNPVIYLQVNLSPVLVSKFTTGYDPANNLGTAIVVNNISLNFGKIVVQYKANTNTGSVGPAVEGGYNMQTGTSARSRSRQFDSPVPTVFRDLTR